VYAQENADAASFIIIIIIKERCGRGQGAEALLQILKAFFFLQQIINRGHRRTHSIKQIINHHTSDD
jgi:hypothetical protein